MKGSQRLRPIITQHNFITHQFLFVNNFLRSNPKIFTTILHRHRLVLLLDRRKGYLMACTKCCRLVAWNRPSTSFGTFTAISAIATTLSSLIARFLGHYSSSLLVGVNDIFIISIYIN